MLVYYANGGMTLSDVVKMNRKKFFWFIKRLRQEKEAENKAIEERVKNVKSGRRSKSSRLIG
jgi:hypothetical protein